MESDADRETSPEVATLEPHTYKNAEYEALRQEILTRNEFRQRTVELTLLSSGAIFAAGLKMEDLGPLLLLYPVAVFFLAASWAHNGIGVLLAGSHIRAQFEGVWARAAGKARGGITRWRVPSRFWPYSRRAASS